jgi:phage shock protein A
MALINRFSRLFTADLHAVLDRIEEPDTLLKQAVREMEEELSAMHAQAKSLRGDLERLDVQQDEVNCRLGELEEELDVCFDSGEEALARNLVKRKLENARHGKAIAARRDAITKTLADLDEGITENRRHLAGMQQKLELLVERMPGPVAVEYPMAEYSVDDDEVDVAFLREKQRRVRS